MEFAIIALLAPIAVVAFALHTVGEPTLSGKDFFELAATLADWLA